MPFSKSMETITQTCPGNRIKYFDENETRDKTTDMGPKRNAPNIARGEACRKQLNEKPIPEEDKSRKLNELKKEKYRDQCQDPGTGVEEKISSHDPRNRSTRSYGRNFGIPVSEEVNQASSHTTKNIEDKVSNVPKPIFYVIPKDIEEPHVPKDMKESSMEKH